MTQKLIDREKVIAVIKAEHDLVHGQLVDPLGRGACANPGHCAIGALLWAAGMTNPELVELSGEPLTWEGIEGATEARAIALLMEHYGLTVDHASALVSANDDDDAEGIESRRARVLAQVNELAEDQLGFYVAAPGPSPRERKEP